jgi:hypothetical protein
MKNSYKQAFPVERIITSRGTQSGEAGLTKREYFAAMAMQGIIAGFDPESKTNGCYIPASEYPMLMMQAHQMADELLKQLEQNH